MKRGDVVMPHEQEHLSNWLGLSQIHAETNQRIEVALLEAHDLSLKEFYVLHFIMQTEGKKLRLQQLQDKVGLSQSATSRLVLRMEAKNCGSLERDICQDDRRGIYTRITASGEAKYCRALQTFQEALRTELERSEVRAEMQRLTEQLLK